ncbi:hypothetical protein GIB67_032655 [Kingdonia uniflora]|uniref:Uncharacterized protein n=1 Tax=Kingdonia uniflora TaxID=39325 RepID=A0A7J7P9R8_9MAGN|nr:hypothetical protein GIB67_032655 [Kingdonia uniflora]
MKLRDVYNVLSNKETRRFYEYWTLAQEIASKKAEKLKMKLKNPYEVELKNFKSVPDMVDRLSGSNMALI